MRYVRLIGVVDDGTDLHPTVPENTARTIVLSRLTDIVIEVEVVNNQGVAQDLASDGNMNSWLTVVQTPDSCEQTAGKYDYQLASTSIKSDTKNVLQFVIPVAAFRRFPAGRYFYDVSLYFNGIRYQIVRVGGLVLEMSFRRA